VSFAEPKPPSITRRAPVQVFKIWAQCPECQPGTMIFQGDGRSNNLGAYWRHKCDCCDYEEEYDKTYPTLEYIESIGKDPR